MTPAVLVFHFFFFKIAITSCRIHTRTHACLCFLAYECSMRFLLQNSVQYIKKKLLDFHLFIFSQDNHNPHLELAISTRKKERLLEKLIFFPCMWWLQRKPGGLSQVDTWLFCQCYICICNSRNSSNGHRILTNICEIGEALSLLMGQHTIAIYIKGIQ